MSISLQKEVIQGTDRHYRLTFTSTDLVDDDNPQGRVDLSGATVYYRWKRNQSDPNPAEIAKSSVDPAEIEILAQSLDPYTMGQADVYLVPADTASLPTGWHYWDAWAVLADGTRVAMKPQKVFLIDAVTDLTAPSPSPTGGPGDNDDVAILERSFALTHQQNDTQLVSLGRVPVDYSAAALTVEVGDDVSAGSIVVNVKLNSVTVLSVTLDGSNPTYGKDIDPVGLNDLDETDTLELEVITTDYENVGGTGSELEVNVALARGAVLSGDAVEPNGFADITDSQISYDDGTRTFTVEPAVSSFNVYVAGKKYVFDSAQDRVWTDDEGVHYFYFTANGALTSSQVYPSFTVTAHVAMLYWDKVNQEALLFAEDRHGMSMAGETHEYLHKTRGAQYESGLAPGGITADDTGDDNSHAQIAIGEGTIWDEDLEHQILDSVQDITPTLSAPVFYRSGAVWRKKDADTFPFVYAGQEGAPGTRLPYNSESGGVWGWTEVTNNAFVLFHVFATNDVSEPVIAVHGQAEYNTINAARTGAEVELLNLHTEGMPFAEFVPVATFILQTADAYSNTPKGRIRTIDGTAEFIDWRGARFVPGAATGAGDHGSLTGLSDDDHPQYLLADGTRAMTGDLDLGGNSIVNAAAVGVSSTADTSNLVSITGRSLTTGDALQIVVDNTMTTGRAIRVLGGAAGATEVFNVDEDGNVYMLGKLTVGGAIDPTSVAVEDAGGQAAYFEAGDGQNAGAAPANKGRIRYNVSTQKWETSANEAAFAVGFVPSTHAASHTDGSDDIQLATDSQKGLMSLAYAGKLDNIEAGADVTDSTNVAAAGAEMTSYKNQANGYAGLDGSTKLAGAQQVYGSGANTACEGNDSRLSDARTPTGSASGQLGGSYPGPDVRGLRETGGPTELTLGAIADGQYLKRVGSTVVGGAVAVSLDDAYNGGTSITVDNGAVTLDADVADGTAALAITREPTSGAAVGVTVSVGANSTGQGIIVTMAGGGGAAFRMLDATNQEAFIEAADGQNAGVSASNEGRLRYNASTQQWEQSSNAGAWGALGGGSGDVTAASTLADHSVIRGDGGAKGVQQSDWEILDGGDLLPKTSGSDNIGSSTAVVNSVFTERVYVQEGAAAATDVNTFGQIWGRSSDSALLFTGDGGVDQGIVLKTGAGFGTDNALVRADGTGYQVQAGDWTLSDAGDLQAGTRGNRIYFSDDAGESVYSSGDNLIDFVAGSGLVLRVADTRVSFNQDARPSTSLGSSLGSASYIWQYGYVSSLMLVEKAAALTDNASFGQFWVENTNPNRPRYTDGDGGDYGIATAAAVLATDNSLLRADGTGYGIQGASYWTLSDAGELSANHTADDTTDVLDIDKNPPGPTSRSGTGLSVNMGAYTTGHGIVATISGSGTSNAIQTQVDANAYGLRVLLQSHLSAKGIIVEESDVAHSQTMVHFHREPTATGRVLDIDNEATSSTAYGIYMSHKANCQALYISVLGAAGSEAAQGLNIQENSLARTQPLVYIQRAALAQAAALHIDANMTGAYDAVDLDYYGSGDALDIRLDGIAGSEAAQALVISETNLARTSALVSITRSSTATGAALHVLGGYTEIGDELIGTKSSQSITAVGNSITGTDNFVVEIDPDGTYTLTSTPTITGGRDGQLLVVTNIDTAYTVTLQDESNLSGSKIRGSGGADVVLAPYESVMFHYGSDGFWHEVRS